MAEFIEREAAYRFAQDQLKKETGAYTKGWNNAMNVMKSAFRNNDALPSADVVARDCYDRLLAENDELRKERPVRHGRWIWNQDGMDWGLGAWCCSECGSKAETWWANDSGYNPLHCSGGHFCGNCGAIMVGVGE